MLESDDAILNALRGVAAPQAPSGLQALIQAEVSAPGTPVSPLREAFDDHAGVVYGYLLGLCGGHGWQAEELLKQAFCKAAEELPGRPGLLRLARLGALETVLTGGDAAVLGLPPADGALLLESRLLSTEALAESWSTLATGLAPRQRAALSAWLDARTADAPRPPCAERVSVLVDAALGLLDDEAAYAHGDHAAACSACAEWSEAMEDCLNLPTTELPAPETTWKALSRPEVLPAGPSAAELGIRVSVSCTYCHDELERGAAAFCAACLAPHHAECFAAHGACSTPGCAGTEVVYPSRPKPARRGRTWLGLTGFVTVAALAGGVAALASRYVDSGSGVASAVALTREVPSLEAGASPKDVEALLGKPEAVFESGAETYYAYYQAGARVIFDEHDRMVQASFFGVLSSDGQVDANGNRPIFAGPTYAAQPWSLRGQVSGEALKRSVLAGVQQDVPDADGNHMLLLDSRYLLEVGPSPRFVVRAIHLGPEVRPDANGNVMPGQFSFEEQLGGREACRRVLQAARADGSLKEVLGTTHFQGYDGGQRRVLVELETQLAPGDQGLDLSLRWWHASDNGDVASGELSERIDWEAALVHATNWNLEGDVGDQVQVRDFRSDRYTHVERQEGKAPVERVVLTANPTYLDPGQDATSRVFAMYVLPMLAQRQDVGEWRVEVNHPLFGSGERLEIDTRVEPIDHDGRAYLPYAWGFLDAETYKPQLVQSPYVIARAEFVEPVSAAQWDARVHAFGEIYVRLLGDQQAARLAWPPGSPAPAWTELSRPR